MNLKMKISDYVDTILRAIFIGICLSICLLSGILLSIQHADLPLP